LSIAAAAMTLAAASERARRPLRVVFCTRGGLFGELVLRRLRACQRIELCGIVRSSRIHHARYGFVRGALAYLSHSGLAYSLYLLCATDIADAVCAASRLRRDRVPRVPVHTTRNLNDAHGLRFLQACAPDLIVSAFFDQRLREAVLAVPPRGCVNIHPSLLPAFKGVDPVLQMRLQGLNRMGVTVHYMTPAFDAGNLLAQQAVDTASDRSIFATTALLFSKGADLFTGEALARIERGEAGTPQPAGGSYDTWPTRAQIRALRAGGGALLRLSDFRQA